MSKRAEEAALKAYPPIATVPKLQDVGTGELYDPHTHERLVYIQGYEQAEKDRSLTWEDVAVLISIYEQEVENGNICRYEDEGAPSLKDASEIILRRFNETRKFNVIGDTLTGYGL